MKNPVFLTFILGLMALFSVPSHAAYAALPAAATGAFTDMGSAFTLLETEGWTLWAIIAIGFIVFKIGSRLVRRVTGAG